MELLKKLTTFLTVLVFTITGVPVSSIASEGDEEAGAFEDPNADEETEKDSGGAAAGAAAAGAAGGAAAGAGVWVAITGAILGLFSGGSSEFTTPSGNPPVIHSLKPNAA